MSVTVNSLSKAVEILRLVAGEQGVGLAMVVKRLGLPKTTTHRLLVNLERTGLVERIEAADSTVFVLGPLVSELAGGFATSQRLAQIARPVMERLRDATNETVLLHVFEGSRRIVVEQVESLQQLRRTYTNLGVPVPLYGGAASKVFLASLTIDELKRHWATFPTSVTKPEKRGAFQKFVLDLQRIRRQGYSMTVSEITPGVTSIAMGIHRPDGRVTACVSVTGPVSRLSFRELRSFRPHLAAAIREIEVALDGSSKGGKPQGLKGDGQWSRASMEKPSERLSGRHVKLVI